MKQTKIEWVRNRDGSRGDTWNVMWGCRKVSPGCTNCYAERFVNGRLRGDFQKLVLKPDRLGDPLHVRKPTTYFVNSLSDLWLAPPAFLDQVLAVMMLTSRHTYIVATKRPQAALDYLAGDPHLRERVAVEMAAFLCCGQRPPGVPELLRPQLPLPNLWHLASCENQLWAERRIPILLEIPAARRGASLEPLLGPIELNHLEHQRYGIDALRGIREDPFGAIVTRDQVPKLDWVIAGGESGPTTQVIRPMNPDWVRSLRDQCRAAGVPFLFKQWGEFLFPGQRGTDGDLVPAGQPVRVGKVAAGRLLDGELCDEMPAWPAEGKA